MNKTEIKDVVIIKMSALGDIVMATPLVHHLKTVTGARISWIVDYTMAPLLEDHPDIDELLYFPRDSFRSLGKDLVKKGILLCRLWQRLKSVQFDWAIDLQGLSRSYLTLKTTRADSKIGRGRFPFLKMSVPHRRSIRRHAVEVNLDVLEFLGIPRPENPRLYLPVSDRKRVEVKKILDQWSAESPFVAFLPSSTWPSKNWPLHYWSKLAEWFIKQGFQVTLVGSEEGRQLGDQISATIPYEKEKKVINLFGSFSIDQLSAFLELPALVIGCDTGPLHIASATSTPIIGLYGPTDPKRTGPWRESRSTILQAPDCRICRRHRCRRKCLDKLLPETVVKAVQKQIR